MALPGRKLQGKKRGKQLQGKKVHANKFTGLNRTGSEARHGSKYREKQSIPLEQRLMQGGARQFFQQKGITFEEAEEKKRIAAEETKRKKYRGW